MSRFLGRTKKALAGLLAVLMVLTSLPANAYAYGDVSNNSAVIDEETNAENTYDDIFIGGLDDVTGDDISDGDISNGEDPVPPDPPKTTTTVYLTIDNVAGRYTGYATAIHLKEYSIVNGEKVYSEDELSVPSEWREKGKPITITSGNGLEVTDIDYPSVQNAKDILFYEVKSGKKTFYTTLGNPFDLGCFSEDTHVFIQSLAYDSGYSGDKPIEVSNPDVESGKINFSSGHSYKEFGSTSLLNHDKEEKIAFNIYIENTGKTLKKYELSGTFSYKVANASPVNIPNEDVEVVAKGRQYTIKIPTVAVAEGIFNGITIIPGVTATGDNDRQIEVRQNEGSTKTTVKVDGVGLSAEGTSALDRSFLDDRRYVNVKPEKTAEVTVTARDGFVLNASYVIKQDYYDAKYDEFYEKTGSYDDADELIREWIIEESKESNGKVNASYDDHDKDGVITFTFKPDDHYYIFNDTTGLVYFEVNGKAVKDGGTITVPYSKSVPIIVYKGSDYVYNPKGDLSAQTEDNDPVSFEYLYDYIAYLNCNNYTGKDITVTYNNGEDTASITVSVQKMLTTDDISFNDKDLTLNVGTKDTVDLVLGDGFFTSGLRDRVDVRFSKGIDVIKTSADFDPVKKTAAVTVESLVTGKMAGNITYLLTCKDLKIELYDKDNNVTITSIPLYLVNTAIKNADLSDVAVTAGADSISFDFSKVEGLDKETDGLYYYIGGSVSGNETTDQLWSSFNGMVPVSKTSSKIILAKDSDSFEEKAIEYKVTVKLVQSTNEIYNEYDWVAKGDSIVKSAKTVPNNLFATGISFKANKKTGKIYTTSGKTELGTVSFKADKKAIARVSEIRIENASKETVFSNDCITGGKALIWEEDNKVFIDPVALGIKKSKFVSGTYTVYIYAMQPKGGELKCSYKVTILPGIEAVSVKYPYFATKKDKTALTIKSELTITPDIRKKDLPKNPVKWSFVEPLDTSNYYRYTGSSSSPVEEAWKTVSYGKSIKIDNSGKITIDKNYKIPNGALELFVCAQANDTAGSTVHDVEVIHLTSQPMPIEGAYIAHLYGNSPEDLFMELQDKESYYSYQLYGSILGYAEETQFGTGEANFKYSGLKEAANADTSKAMVKGQPVMYAPAITKKASVTVTSKFDSKNTATVSFSVKSDEELHLDLYNDQGESVLNNARKANDGSYVLISRALMGESYKLVVDGKNKSLIDHSIKTEGGKYKKVSSGEYFKAAKSYGTVYSITPDSESTLIKITDKTVPDKVVKVYIVNTNILTEKSNPVTSVTASNKYVSEYNTVTNKSKITDNKGNIFSRLYHYGRSMYEALGSVNEVTYTVNIDGDPASYQTILVSTKDSPILTAIFSKDYTLKDGTFEIELDKKGQFTIDYADYVYKEKKVGPLGAVPTGGSYYSETPFFDIPEGSYSFTVTPVYESKGEVSAIAKPATFKFSAKPAPKASVSLKKTTFKNFVSKAKLSFGTMKNVGIVTTSGNSSPFYNFMDCRGVNNKGKINRFESVFKIRSSNLVCIKAPRDYDDEYTKNPNKGMSGYVGYMWMNLDGSYGTAFEKVTVKPVKNGDIITEDLGN